METKPGIFKLLIVVCGVFATTAGFGQVFFTWTNSAGIDIGAPSNYTPNGTPIGNDGSGFSQTARWDGLAPGNLVLRYITAWTNTGFGTIGVNLVLTPNQVGNVTILQPVVGNSPPAGINNISNLSATAALVLGDASANFLAFASRPGNFGTYHAFVNNSAAPAVWNSSVNWVFGGGVQCDFAFGGTGDWIINHSLRANNTPGPYVVILEGPGSLTWSNGGTFVSNGGPLTNRGGLVTLKGAGLLPNYTGVPVGNNTITLSNTVGSAVLRYDATVADTIPRVIYGDGTLQVNNGSLTLSGQSRYTGTTLLSGGELVVGATENLGVSGPLGVGGAISFTGGALKYSAISTYDYSPRFSQAASQQYRIDSGGQNVLLTNSLTSTGGSFTKVGSGTVILSGTSSYSGLTTVSAGSLVFQGPKTGTGSITIANSTSLGIFVTGTQVTPTTLTVGTSSSATLDFDGVNSATTPPIAAGSVVAAGGPITVNINSGTLAPGNSYPLFSWSSGSAPGVSLGFLNGFVANLTTNGGDTIVLNVTATGYKWTGLNNGSWDLVTGNNWIQNGGPVVFANGGPALLDDTASGNTSITISGALLPTAVTFNNTSSNYSLATSPGNGIGGSTTLTKAGGGLLAISGGGNTYTGVTRLDAGTTSVDTLANGGAASDIGASANSAANLVFNSGALRYNGGAVSVDRLFTLGTLGGTIDSSGSGALNLNNSGPIAYIGIGARVFTLAGSEPGNNTLAVALADNGGATALTKNGPGKWILTGTNSHSGVTTNANGTLQVGAGGALGSLGTGTVLNNGALVFNRTGTLTVNTISGTGSVTNDGTGTIILPGNNTYQGGTTVNAGTLQIGAGGFSGTIDFNDPVLNNGTLIFNSTGDLTLSGAISGTGNLIKRGSGLLRFLGNNTYTGNTTIDPGARLQLWQNNTGSTTTPAITNNGTLIMMRQDQLVAFYRGNISGSGVVRIEHCCGNFGDSTLTGTNTYSGGTFILGGGLVLGDGGAGGSPGGSIVGNVFMTNDYLHSVGGPGTYIPATLTFNRPVDYTFAGNIVGDGNVVQNGLAVLTLTGVNTYTNGTTIGAGTLQVGNGGTTGWIGSGAIANNGVLVFNRSDDIAVTRVISGSGSVVKAGAGKLTLSGANTYFGSLIVSNGTLIVNRVEDLGVSGPLGVGGTISFSGGTLGFSLNNTYDYSPRFSTAAGQVYRFDTGGQSVTFTNDLASAGGTLSKIGSGTLALSGTSSYSGSTTVGAGRLVFQGSKTGTGDITVANGAFLNVIATGTQIMPTTFTVGTSSSATLEFDGVNSTTTAPIAAGTVSAGDTITININSGTFIFGQSYPLLTWSAGSAPGVSLGFLNGFNGYLATNGGNTIVLNVTGDTYKWTGLINGNWDTVTASNWTQNGFPVVFQNGVPTLFDDSASGTTSITIIGAVLPTAVTFSNSSLNYAISSSPGNGIGGSITVIKVGSGPLALSGGGNTYTGVTRLEGGTTSVSALANGGAGSDIGAAANSATNLIFNSGTLRYNGGAASVDRLFALGTLGGAIDASGSGPLTLNNSGPVAYSGAGSRVFTLTGTDTGDNTLAVALADNGGATAITKAGPGKWILTGTNSNSGATTIAGGTLQIGAGGATGSSGTGSVTNNGALVFNRTGTLTVSTVIGTGSVTNDGSGVVILAGNNTYQGGTTINAGTLQIGSGGATGTIDPNDPVLNNGTLIFNSTNDFTLAGAISGTGNLIKRGSGILKFLGNNTYTGTTTIDPGARLQLWQNNLGSTATPWITNNGTLIMMRQDLNIATYRGNITGSGVVRVEVSNGNFGDSTLTGTNTYSGGTYILGGGLVLGDGGSGGSPGGSITGNVMMANDYVHSVGGPGTYIPATLTFNRPEDYTFAGNIVGDGNVIQNGFSVLTFTGVNTYTNGTTINAGTLQVGNGGTTGWIGSGAIANNGVLVFNRSDNVTVSRVISGSGTVVKAGAGKLTLSGANTYFGSLIVSNGTLVVNGSELPVQVNVYSGTLGGAGTITAPVITAPGSTLAPGTSVGTLTINGDLSIGGNLAIEVNRALSPSNDVVAVSGVLTNTGTGTLTVTNLGSILVSGDKFTLFNKPVLNGAAISVTGAGATWINNLALDGSITVNAITRPTLNFTQVGDSLQFSWSTNLGAYKLQAQTNSLVVGLGTNWSDYPGNGNSPVIVPIVRTNPTVFFRIAPANFLYDQQSTTDDASVALLSGNYLPLGQSFLPTFSSVGFVRLFFSVFYVPGATIHVNLWSNAIGTGTLLGSTASVSLPIGFNGATDFFFVPPVTVNPGTTNCFEIVTEVGSVNLHVATATAYSNGDAILFGTPVSIYDLLFREGVVAP